MRKLSRSLESQKQIKIEYIYIYVCVCVCVCVCMCIFQNIIGYNDSAETCKIRLKSNISSKMAR